MSKLTQTQQDALHCVLTRLNPDDPGNTASDEVKAHLRAMGPFLDAWVIPYLEAVQPNAARWLVEAVKQDAARMRKRQKGAS